VGASQPDVARNADTAVPEEGSIEALICSYDWDCGTALRIAECESGMDPSAVGWTGESFGLFQLYAPVWAHVFPGFWELWAHAEWNTASAWTIYVRAGYSWAPWDCRP